MKNNSGRSSANSSLRHRALAAVAAAALGLSGVAALAAPAAPASAADGSTRNKLLAGQTHTVFEDGRYIVALADDPVATYQGGVAGFAPTAPDAGDQLNARKQPVQSYAEYLGEQQSAVAQDAGVEIQDSYTMSLNGFSAQLTAEQAAALAADRRVVDLQPDELLQVTAAVPSTEFLGLTGDSGVWAALGGTDKAGAGVVVGVLDTGIAPENPSFAGGAFGSEPGGPTRSGDTISYVKGDGQTFTGVCQAGNAAGQFDGSECNTKIVGARYYLDGFGESALGIGSPGVAEYVSPRDGDGHGSHTASTAAGNFGVDANVLGIQYPAISGVAPAAKIAAYKVCWSGPDPAVTTDDGCTSTDIIAAIDQAVIDGVDVLNYSIGGGAAQTTVSFTDQAFLGAAAAGVFVAASAGNSGPGASTLDNAAPWVTTVAASTIPSYEAEAAFGNGQTYAGASITVNEPVTGEVVTAASVAVAGATTPNLCVPGSLDPALVAGKIVVCERGGNARAEKSQVVKDAGGIGVVLVNVVPGSLDLDEHAVPTVHLDAQYRDAVFAAASVPGATVTLQVGNTTGITPPVPQVAGFSSRGPVVADGSDVLKPDVSAPGVGILAAGANAAGENPTWQFLSGTSMSSPQVAGLAALYLGVNPQATPAEVKSALMTSAYDTVDANGDPISDPFAQGAGHVDPTLFLDPGLAYLTDTPDWLSYIEGVGIEVGADVEPIDPSQLNLASISIGALTAPETIVRTVTALDAGTYTASVAGVAGVEVSVSPATFTIAAGRSQKLEISFDRTTAALDEWATGSFTLTSADHAVRSPIAVQPVTLIAPADADGTGTTGATEISVTPGGTGPIALATTGLAKGELLKDPANPDGENSGIGTSNTDVVDYPVTVPAGAEFARFDLDTLDDTADLDLYVLRLDDAGTPVEQWTSATGAADERVDIVAPTAGNYIVQVVVFSVPGPTPWNLVATSVVPGATAPLTLTPATLDAVQGVPTPYTASWADLDTFSSYLGLISYGDTGRVTALTVTTEETVVVGAPVNLTPPTISGKPDVGQKLIADPGTWDSDDLTFGYQWQRDGAAIAGATKVRYTVKPVDAGTALTVVVTATTPDGVSASATSAAVTVRLVTGTKASVSPQVLFSWQRVIVKTTVTSSGAAAAAPPTGTVTITVNNKKYEVPGTIDANGKVSYQLPKLGAGFWTVRATYNGDTLHSPSTSSSRLFWVIF